MHTSVFFMGFACLSIITDPADQYETHVYGNLLSITISIRLHHCNTLLVLTPA